MPKKKKPSIAERLREAEDTLEAIRGGHVDALVVQGPKGEQIFTLKGADRRFRQLVETMNEGALLLGPTGTIVYGNARFAQLVGVPMESVIGSSLSAYVAEQSKPVVAGLLRARAAKAEVELVDARGGRHPVYLSATAGWDEELELTCMIATDLSDLRLLDAANLARAEAEGANLAKDQFLAMLGHELRNPLAPILTALELMTLRGEESSRREREIIERHVKHVVTLVGDLLDVSRIAQGKVTLENRPVDLALVIDDAVESVGPLIEERRHKLTVDAPAGLWVAGDAGRLCQVIANLLTNAARYTKREGAIAVAARREGDEIVVVVRDNGVGIPPELLPTLFDMFVQGKRTIERTEGGLGLGLSIVKSLVALHAGSVAVRSDGPGRGSEFEVRLPALAKVPLHTEVTGRVDEAKQVRARHRVMVVDDNVDAADLLAEAIEQSGHIARTAYDGPSALALANEFEPEIAVLDIGLPVMDGYELARRLRDRERSTTQLRLYAVTGYGRDSDQRAARDAGFDGHFVKPIDLNVLMATLTRPRPS